MDCLKRLDVFVQVAEENLDDYPQTSFGTAPTAVATLRHIRCPLPNLFVRVSPDESIIFTCFL